MAFARFKIVAVRLGRDVDEFALGGDGRAEGLSDALQSAEHDLFPFPVPSDPGTFLSDLFCTLNIAPRPLLSNGRCESYFLSGSFSFPEYWREVAPIPGSVDSWQ